jgi:hypothetical protein
VCEAARAASREDNSAGLSADVSRNAVEVGLVRPRPHVVPPCYTPGAQPVTCALWATVRVVVEKNELFARHCTRKHRAAFSKRHCWIRARINTTSYPSCNAVDRRNQRRDRRGSTDVRGGTGRWNEDAGPSLVRLVNGGLLRRREPRGRVCLTNKQAQVSLLDAHASPGGRCRCGG